MVLACRPCHYNSKLETGGSTPDTLRLMNRIVERFARLKREGETAEPGEFPDTPDLVLIDGGRGQFEAICSPPAKWPICPAGLTREPNKFKPRSPAT